MMKGIIVMNYRKRTYSRFYSILVFFALLMSLFSCRDLSLLLGSDKYIRKPILYKITEPICGIYQEKSSLRPNDVAITSSWENDSLCVSVKNNTSDTLYVFDSYMNDVQIGKDIMHSKYLHRYDKSSGQYKISLLPFFPYLGIGEPFFDVISFNYNRIVKRGYTMYTFQEIKPYSSFDFKIPKTAFEIMEYVEDLDIYFYERWDFGIKFEDYNVESPPSSIIIELGIYKDIKNIYRNESFYFNEYEFNEHIHEISVVSFEVDLK